MSRAMMKSFIALIALLPAVAAAQTREEKVRNDRKKVEAEGFWIYNDLAKGFREAKETGKPLFVILRCIPCEECVKLDDDLVDQDKRVRPLLEKFVCVRLVSTNGLDLSLFQFDYDQSFAAFFLNADRTIYGRFGTRSHRTNWSDDVSIEGLAKALRMALVLHKDYPNNREALAGKTGPAPDVASPEHFPSLEGKYRSTLDYEGQVVQSCIHCHQVGDAIRQLYRDKKEPIPEQILFPYPHPKSLGLILDPRERAAVLSVEPGSPAAEAGFEKGDSIESIQGQPLLSIADVQWLLHQAPPEGASLKALVLRNKRLREVVLSLPGGWRQRDDIAWRATSWDLRRMATGGLVLKSLTREQRKEGGFADNQMALRVDYVGQYGAHAVAKEAGFREGDIITSFDGQTDLARETDLMAYALSSRRPGDKVPVTLVREGQEISLVLPMQ